MSTQPATPRSKKAPATQAAIQSPATSARTKAGTSPAAGPAIARPAAPGAPVRATKAATAPAPAAEKPARRTAPRPGAAGDAALPSLRFHHSHALREKTLVVIDAIETGPAARGHGESLANLVAELVQAGMDWYFFRPLQRAQVGFMAEQSARLGLNTATKMINSASRGFILRMDHRQLQVVAAYLREIS